MVIFITATRSKTIVTGTELDLAIRQTSARGDGAIPSPLGVLGRRKAALKQLLVGMLISDSDSDSDSSFQALAIRNGHNA